MINVSWERAFTRAGMVTLCVAVGIVVASVVTTTISIIRAPK